MVYINYETLCRDIRENLSKIPRDVCGVIGIPRSGMLPATMIAEYLNVGLTTMDAAIAMGSVEAALSIHGGRHLRQTSGKRLLVVDDTCSEGAAMFNTMSKFHSPAFAGYEMVYLVVYLEGPCRISMPHVWLKDIRQEAQNCRIGYALYEWNIFAHDGLTARTLFDLDGVLCQEPPDERDTEAYEAYLPKATPLYIPTGRISICTYRMEKYRKETMEFLASVGLPNVNLYMFQGERGDMPAWRFKAEHYKDDRWLLFIESSDYQAEKIHDATGKPVMCIETNRIYG